MLKRNTKKLKFWKSSKSSSLKLSSRMLSSWSIKSVFPKEWCSCLKLQLWSFSWFQLLSNPMSSRWFTWPLSFDTHSVARSTNSLQDSVSTCRSVCRPNMLSTGLTCQNIQSWSHISSQRNLKTSHLLRWLKMRITCRRRSSHSRSCYTLCRILWANLTSFSFPISLDSESIQSS